MITHRHIANIKHRTFNIRAFGDLQKGEAGFRADLWKRWKSDALKDRTALILGMGDYSDSFRQTVDFKIRHALLEDGSAYSQFDDMVFKETEQLAAELKPFASRMIGLHEGHHYHTFANGTTSTQHLCQLLRVKYLGFFAAIQLIVRRSDRGHKVNIISTHGCGGASLVSADLKNFESRIIPYWDADLYLRGHSTKVYVIPHHPLNTFSENRGNGDLKIIQKRRLIVNTGGFMDGYQEGHSGYVERSNMPPAQLGWAVVKIHENKQGEIELSGEAITPS